MNKLFAVSRVAFDHPDNNFVGITDQKNELVCLVGRQDEGDKTGEGPVAQRAYRLRLALELIEGIPLDLLEEIASRQYSPEERAELLSRLRIAWYAANRMNRAPVRHIQPENSAHP